MKNQVTERRKCFTKRIGRKYRLTYKPVLNKRMTTRE